MASVTGRIALSGLTRAGGGGNVTPGVEQPPFIDGRPEAYSVEFFNKIYKPMQRDEKVWEEMSQKYGINYVFFAHTDMTEWADEFLTRISKDEKWPMVFLNDAVYFRHDS